MKKILVLLLSVVTFACCTPQSGNPDDNIRQGKKTTETTKPVVEAPKHYTLILHFIDGTQKEIQDTYDHIYPDSKYIKIVKGDVIFIHVGQYNITYER